MGFGLYQLRDARISGSEVAVQILATDEGPGIADEVDPAEEADASGDSEDLEDEDLAEPAPEAPIGVGSRVQI
jgi:hypothetical protein